jgi:hypothetical protein
VFDDYGTPLPAAFRMAAWMVQTDPERAMKELFRLADKLEQEMRQEAASAGLVTRGPVSPSAAHEVGQLDRIDTPDLPPIPWAGIHRGGS